MKAFWNQRSRRIPNDSKARPPVRRRAFLRLEDLERRELLSSAPTTPITDMTAWAQATTTTPPTQTILWLNFDGWAAQGISPFIPVGADSLDQDIHDILFRTSEIFAPFNVQVERLTGDGQYDSDVFGNTTVFIGGDSHNSVTASDGTVSKYTYSHTNAANNDYPHQSDYTHVPNSNANDICYVDPVQNDRSGAPFYDGLNTQQIAESIAHEAGHTFGLAHVRTDGLADPAALSSTDIPPDMMSYNLPNQYFANQTLPVTIWNNNGTSTTLNQGVAPYSYFLAAGLPVPVQITTQNSYTYLQYVLGSRGSNVNDHVISDGTVDPNIRSAAGLPFFTFFPVDTVVNGTLTRPGDFEVGAYETPSNKPLQLSVAAGTSSGADPYLMLFDLSGNLVSYEHGGSIVVNAPTFTFYYVVVGDFGTQASGAYQLSVTSVPATMALVSGKLTIDGSKAGSGNKVVMRQDVDPSKIDVSMTVGTPAVGSTFTGTLTSTFATSSFSSVVITPGSGNDHVELDYTPAGKPVQVQMRSGDMVDVGSGGSLQNILGDVSFGGSGTATVNIDASAMPKRTVTLDTQSGTTSGKITGLTSANISYAYANVRSLNITTGSGDVVHVLASRAPTVVTAAAFNRVLIGDTAHNLGSITGALSVNGAGDTDVVVEDRGGMTLPVGYSTYVPLSSRYTFANQQLTRSATALTQLSGSTALPVARTLNDTIRTANLASFTVHGGPDGTVVYQIDSIMGANAFTIYAGATDTIFVSDPTHNLSDVSNLTVNGNGRTSLIFDDRGNATLPAGYTTYIPEFTQFFIDSQQLTRQAQAFALPSALPQPVFFTETYHYSGLANLSVRGGNGTDLFNILSTTVSAAVSGGTTQNVFLIAGAGNSLDPIQGPVAITGGHGSNSVTIDDRGTAAVQDYEFTTTQFTRTPNSTPGGPPSTTVTFSGIQSLEFHSGPGHENVVGISGVRSGTSVALYGNTDYTEFLVGSAADTLDTFQGSLAIHGGPNALYNFVEFIDSQNTVGHSYTLTTGKLQRNSMSPLTYDGLQAVILETGDNTNTGPSTDTVSVQSTGANTATVVAEGSGDITTLGMATGTGRSLQNLLGRVVVQSAYVPSETPSLIIDDSGNANVTPRQVTIADGGNSATSITGLSPAPIEVVFNSGGKVSLIGNASNETFAFEMVPVFQMSINGKGGTNALDYSGYGGDVTVDLSLRTATGLSLGIQNIRNVTGSNGNNLLVGDANANLLTGGTGRNILIGGAGADQITGGSGDNILIGGTTSYDTNLTALELVMQEWLETSSFAARQAAVRSGSDLLAGTGIHFDSTTVFSDGAANAVTPGPGNNWTF